MKAKKQRALQILADMTDGESFSARRYSLENLENEEPFYDSLVDFTFEKYGETIRHSEPINLNHYLKHLDRPLFSYFLDGSRRTYKVGDIQYGERVYPLVVGQLGVSCCHRKQPDDFKSVVVKNRIVLSVPVSANPDGSGYVDDSPYYSKIVESINDNSILKRVGIKLDKIIPYQEKEEFEYTKLAIATLHQEMMDMEKEVVNWLVQEKRLLTYNERLIKDGSIEYQKSSYGTFKDISRFITNYQSVVGVSKRFNPEKCVDRDGKSNAAKIASLPLYHRTPVFKFKSERSGISEKPVLIAAWYIRIRDTKRTLSPFDGVIKAERILISDSEIENGLDSEEVDLISANLINERNPTCYGADQRWANHLYPIYLTELCVKNNRVSDHVIMNIL